MPTFALLVGSRLPGETFCVCDAAFPPGGIWGVCPTPVTVSDYREQPAGFEYGRMISGRRSVDKYPRASLWVRRRGQLVTRRNVRLQERFCL